MGRSGWFLNLTRGERSNRLLNQDFYDIVEGLAQAFIEVKQEQGWSDADTVVMPIDDTYYEFETFHAEEDVHIHCLDSNSFIVGLIGGIQMTLVQFHFDDTTYKTTSTRDVYTRAPRE